jgi:hypothetical protein
MCFPEHAFTNAQISFLMSIASVAYFRTVRKMAQTFLTCGTLDQETREEPINGIMAA